VTVRSAYYEGSAGLVRLILVSLILLFMLVPLMIGAAIFTTGVVVSGTSLSLGEQLLLVFLSLVIAIPGIVLIIRSLWGLYVVFETSKGPVEAVAQSRRLTRGRRLPLLGRLIALGIFLIVGLLPMLAVFGGLAYLTHLAIFTILLNVILGILVIPISNFYLYRIYRGLA